MIIDTHCHLDDKSYDEDLDEVIKKAFENGIKNIIIPGADIKDLPKACKIASQFAEIFFAAGVHPYCVDGYDRALLKEFSKDLKCVGIGECGLDYFRLPKDNVEQYKLEQKRVFIDQIELACELKKPLIVHIRDANNDSLEILKSYEKDLIGGVLHCYNASSILLDLKQKFYYGIGGVLTFKNAKKLVEILPQIPLDRILIETDGPYLTPVPHRGSRNEPVYTNLVVQKISELLNLDRNDIENVTTKNAKNLFRI